MKIFRLILLVSLSISSLPAKNVPTPVMAVSFAMNRDPKKWVGQISAAEELYIIFEFVPAGESVNAWKEMVEQQIGFTPASLRDYVDVWKKGMLRSDSKLIINEQMEKDGSLIAAYASAVGQEIGVRRFIKGKDGIYMLSYMVRPKYRDDARLKIWMDIIYSATLVSNPQRR